MRHLTLLLAIWFTMTAALAQAMKPGDILPSATLPTATAVTAVGFTPDSKLLIGAVTGRISVWDATTGGIKLPLTGFRSTITSIAFSPDSKLIAGGSQWMDTNIRVWAFDNSEPKMVIDQGAPVTALAFSRDGKWLASSGPDRAIRVWDANTGALSKTLTGLLQPATALSWLPSGKLQSIGGGFGKVLATPGRSGQRGEGDAWAKEIETQGEYAVWDIEAGTLALKLPIPKGSQFAAFCPDGSRLAMAGAQALVTKTEREEIEWQNNQPYAWNVGEDEAKIAPLAEMQGLSSYLNSIGLQSIAWSYDNSLLVACTEESVHVWRPAVTGPRVRETYIAPTLQPDKTTRVIKGTGCVALSPDGRLLIAGDGKPKARDGHGIQIWGIVQE